MSDTPRTDAERSRIRRDVTIFVVEELEEMAKFARKLECELNTAKNIIADLLDHPYPHDLMAIRKEAAGYTSEEYAAEEMEAYCTEEAALKARTEWKLTQETAREFLKS